jgi:hypothetical protein
MQRGDKVKIVNRYSPHSGETGTIVDRIVGQGVIRPFPMGAVVKLDTTEEEVWVFWDELEHLESPQINDPTRYERSLL